MRSSLQSAQLDTDEEDTSKTAGKRRLLAKVTSASVRRVSLEGQGARSRGSDRTALGDCCKSHCNPVRNKLIDLLHVCCEVRHTVQSTCVQASSTVLLRGKEDILTCACDVHSGYRVHAFLTIHVASESENEKMCTKLLNSGA